jgi:phospholipase/carboxylesterase
MYKPNIPEYAGPVNWVGPDDLGYEVSGLMRQVVPHGVAIVTPRAPINIGHGGYIWFNQNGQLTGQGDHSLEESLATLKYFLNTLPDLYPLDPDQMILIGFSQGAAMANSLALTRPNLISGVASLSGLIAEMPKGIPQADFLTGLPVFIAHGTEDDTVPLARARDTRDTYEQLGADVTYGEYAIGHKVNTQGIKALKAWLAKVINSK